MSDRSSFGRVIDLATCLERVRESQARGERVVLTNGCFDILHRGHVEYLQASADLGERLVVAINSDQSVKQLKGPSRPVQCQEDRAAILAGLRCVDWVFVFEGPRLAQEISLLRPDIYTKAGDYTLETLEPTERQSLEACQAKIVLIPFLDGRSTTQILEKSQAKIEDRS